MWRLASDEEQLMAYASRRVKRRQLLRNHGRVRMSCVAAIGDFKVAACVMPYAENDSENAATALGNGGGRYRRRVCSTIVVKCRAFAISQCAGVP